jgi:hypothetical protein
MSPQEAEYQLAMANAQIERDIVSRSLDMIQPVGPALTPTFTAGALANPLAMQLRPVGLVKRLYVEVSGQFNPTTNNSTLTTLGLCNLFSNVTLYDLTNQVRINTTGWHLHMIASARRQFPFASTGTCSDINGFGENFRVAGVFNNAAGRASATRVAQGGTLTAGTVYPFKFVYEVPLSYSDTDLHGAIYANTTSANVQLQMTLNPQMVVTAAAGVNPVQAVLRDAQTTGATTTTVTNLSVTVYQNYLDQLPVDQNGDVLLPPADMRTAYMLYNTYYTGLSVNQVQPISYANQRNFLSTIVIYDNAGVLNVNDSSQDIALFQLQTANLTNIFQYDEQLSALQTRNKLWEDFPAGAYYFDHRLKPINTIQFGNQQLTVTPSVVTNSTSQLLVGFEALAPIGAALTGGSVRMS